MQDTQHLHKYLKLSRDDCLILRMNLSAYVYLMDDINYDSYSRQEEFEYYGGLAKSSPYKIETPYPGYWHLVIEQEDETRRLDISVEISRL